MRARVIAQVINRSTYRHRPPSAGPPLPSPALVAERVVASTRRNIAFAQRLLRLDLAFSRFPAFGISLARSSDAEKTRLLTTFEIAPRPSFPISRKRGFKASGFLLEELSRFRALGVSDVQDRPIRLRRGGSPASGLC